ncbi:MAG: iron-containing alcohol dehydrogenase [Ruminococcus sp.]
MGYSFVMPKKVFTGNNALENAKSDIALLGKKAFIVAGPTVTKLGILNPVTDFLDEIGTQYTVFTGITGEPTDKMVGEGVSCFSENGPFDYFIGVGGGSPLDSMKAINAIASNGGNISDYMGKTIEYCKYPMVAVPTTAGTGSEATKFTIITDTEKDIKMLLSGDCLVPDYAIVDPCFTMTATKSITAATGLDAFCHAAESYTSRKAQPLTDTLALSAVKRIFKYLPLAYKDGNDVKAREQMAIASLEAGICINNASVTIIHGMSRPIGAMFHVPHGLSNAMLLPECFSFAFDGAYDKFGELGRACGVADISDDDKTAGEKFIEGVKWLCKECEVPTLWEYGIDKDDFMAVVDKMAEDAVVSGSPSNTIKECNIEDVKTIYNKLWN